VVAHGGFGGSAAADRGMYVGGAADGGLAGEADVSVSGGDDVARGSCRGVELGLRWWRAGGGARVAAW
jgi:hypothetical protein